VLDDLGNGGVPVVPVSVTKNAVTPHHEIVGVAVRESRGDGHLVRAAPAGAVAVGEVRLAQRGACAVLRSGNPSRKDIQAPIEESLQGPTL